MGTTLRKVSTDDDDHSSGGGGGGGDGDRGNLLAAIRSGANLKKVSEAPKPAPAPAATGLDGLAGALSAALMARNAVIQDGRMCDVVCVCVCVCVCVFSFIYLF